MRGVLTVSSKRSVERITKRNRGERLTGGASRGPRPVGGELH